MTNPEYRTRDGERDDYEHGFTPEWGAASDHALRSHAKSTIDDDTYGIAP